MKSIRLTRGVVALVDDADYARLSQRKWFARLCVGRLFYAASGRWPNTVHMHREILDAPAELQVDHINGDGLDNRRCNLRLATRQQNIANALHRVPGPSGYFGVYWWPRTQKWKAAVGSRANRVHVGYFATAEEAALERDRVAIALYGKFAQLNFPDRVGERAITEHFKTTGEVVPGVDISRGERLDIR